MYQKIADAVNKHLSYTGCSNEIEAADVEEYLRTGQSAFLSDPEMILIEDYLDMFL